jgi:hypothetical protein
VEGGGRDGGGDDLGAGKRWLTQIADCRMPERLEACLNFKVVFDR